MSHPIAPVSAAVTKLPLQELPKPQPPVVKLPVAQAPAAAVPHKFSILSAQRPPFHKLSPFHHSGCFHRLVEGFKRFIRWALRQSPPFPMKKNELAMLMQMYRSSDEALAEMTKDGKIKDFELPFSYILKNWGNFLKRFEKVTQFKNEDDNYKSARMSLFPLSKQLLKCGHQQAKIEKIESLPKRKQLAAFKSLRADVLKDIKKLPFGGVTYIPAGIHDESGYRPMILEFKYTKEDEYQIRAITVPSKPGDNSEPSSDIILNKTVHKADLKVSLTKMLGAAIKWKGLLGPIRLAQEFVGKQPLLDPKDPQNQNLTIFELLDKVRKAEKGTDREQMIGFIKKVRIFKVVSDLIEAVGFVNVLKLAFSKSFRKRFDKNGAWERFSNLDPRFKTQMNHSKEIYKIDKVRNTYTAEKVTEVFLKTLHTDLADTLKMSFKTSLLDEIFQKSKDDLTKYPDLHRELHNEILNLYRSIEKHQSKQDLQPHIDTLKRMLDDLDRKKSTTRLVPPSPAEQKDIKAEFKGVIVIKDSIMPLKAFTVIPPANDKTPFIQKSPFAPPASITDNAIILKSCSDWLESCKNLTANKDFAYLDTALFWISTQLGKIEDNFDPSVWSQGELLQLSNYTRSFVQQTVIMQNKLSRQGISVEVLNQILTGWQLCNRISSFLSGGQTSLNEKSLQEVQNHPYFEYGVKSAAWLKAKNLFNGMQLDITQQEMKTFQEELNTGNIATVNPIDPNLDLIALNESLNKDLKWIQLSLDKVTNLEKYKPEQNGPQVKDSEIQQRIVEGCISDDGKHPNPENKSGKPQSLHQIMDERFCFKGLSVDVSIELQLMQANPINHTRLKNTLGAFIKIPGVFGDPIIGTEWQRVFQLNLFHKGELIACLEHEPEYLLTYTQVLRGMMLDAQASGNIPATLFLMRIYRDSHTLLKAFVGPHLKDEKNLQGEKAMLWKKIETDLEQMEKNLNIDLEQIKAWKNQAEADLILMSNGGPLTNAVRNRCLIHHDYLYHTSKGPFDEESILKEIFVSHFIVKQFQPPLTEINWDVEKSIDLLLFQTQPLIDAKIKSFSGNNLSEWLNPLLPPKGQNNGNSWKAHPQFPFYAVHEYVLDLDKNILYINNKVKRAIPSRIGSHPQVEKIFGKNTLYTLQANYKNVLRKFSKNSEEHAERYSFEYQDNKYRIVERHDREILIYKHYRTPGSKRYSWLQLHENTFLTPKDKIPREVKTSLCWVHEKLDFILTAGNDSKSCFYVELKKSLPSEWKEKGKINPNPLRTLSKIYSGQKDQQILNPWTNPSFKIFESLDDPTTIYAKGKKGKVDDITYSKLPLSYQWNEAKKRWLCKQHKDYALSNQKINTFLPLAQNSKALETALFRSPFFDYQILEHANLPPKLLLNRCEYALVQEKRYAQRLSDIGSKLITFEIDPQKGLKSPNASDYFYVCYLLFTQKKYSEAITYLKRAHSLDIGKDPDFIPILQWFRKWKDSSVEGKAFLLHLEAQVAEHQLFNQGAALLSEEEQLRTMSLYQSYMGYNQNALPSSLHLSAIEKFMIEERCKINLLKTQMQIKSILKQHPLAIRFVESVTGKSAEAVKDFVHHGLNEPMRLFKEALQNVGIDFEEFLALANADALSDKEMEKSGLDRIKRLAPIALDNPLRLTTHLRKELEKFNLPAVVENPNQNIDESFVPVPLFPEALLKELLNTPPIPPDVKQKWSDQIAELQKSFLREEEDGAFLYEKGIELADDIKLATEKGKSIRQLSDTLNLNNLRKSFIDGDAHQPGLEPLSKDVFQIRTKLIDILQLASLQRSEWENLLVRIEERHETVNCILDRARHCYAADTMDELVKEGWILEKDLPVFKQTLEEFLVKDSLRQQYVKLLDKMTKMQNAGDWDILAPQVTHILEQKRAYDVKNDPQRALLLAFEWESGYIATPAQIKNFRTMIAKSSHYMQEALAGGKTEIIRNIITKAIAKKGTCLAGVITHAPLVEMHHPKFERVAREVYGDKVYKFEFSRKSATDAYALTQLLYNLKKTIAEKGRIDLTKRDLLSLHHAVILKWQEVEPSDLVQRKPLLPSRDQLTLHKEIDILSEILKLLEERLVIGSDEFDTICNCEEEHIFATRNPKDHLDKSSGRLNPHKVDIAVKIGSWILTEEGLKKEKEIFRSNRQSKMDDKSKWEFIHKIASLIHQKYAPTLNKDNLLQYLMGPSYQVVNPLIPYKEDQVEKCYRNEIRPHSKNIELGIFRKYLQEIIPGTLKKQGGVKFGRSADGWIVKPYESSDVCMENSEQSSEEETIWYTVSNYIDTTLGGVKPDQINELVLSKQMEASKEVKLARRLDKIVEYNSTETAKAWSKNFKHPLQDIVPENYQEIAKQINDAELINEQEDLWSKFMKEFVFAKYSSSSHKIPGNAHDIAGMVKEFYGSSGTSESHRTFPEQIERVPELVRQKGINGSVLFALMKTYKAGDIIKSDNIINTLGKEMKEGDTVIDLAPAFPGLAGKNIALAIGQKLKEQNTLSQQGVIRFINRQNEACVLDIATGTDERLSSSVNVAKTTTILAQKDTRGTNFEMADNSIGYLTVGVHTTLTDFLQAALRMRKLPERLLSDSDVGQKVRYIIDPAVAAQMKAEPTFEDLIAFVTNNEVELLKQLHYKSEKQKIDALVRTTLFRTLHQVQDHEARSIIWPMINKFFIQRSQQSVEDAAEPSAMKNPLDELLRILKQKKNEVIEAGKWLSDIVLNLEPNFIRNHPQTPAGLRAFGQELEMLVRKLTDKENDGLLDAKYLPKAVPAKAQEMDNHQSVEQEQELQAEQQQQLQQQQISVKAQPVKSKWKELGLMSSSPEKLCDQLYSIFKKRDNPEEVDRNGVFQSLKKCVHYFDDLTYFTINGYPNFLDDYKPWSFLDPQLLSGQIFFPRFFLMVDKRHRPYRVYSIVGTPNDFANEFDPFAHMHKNHPTIDIYIPNLRNDHLDGGRYDWAENYPANTVQEIARRLVEMKFMLGEIDLLNPSELERSPIRHEYKAFENWLKELISSGKVSAEVLENTFIGFLHAYRPSQIPQYHTSAVAAIFKTLKE